MNHARIAQEAADETGLPHYVGRFHDGYRMQSTNPQVLVELGAISIEAYAPEGWSYDLIQREPEHHDESYDDPYVEPAPQWMRIALYACAAAWGIIVWGLVIWAVSKL